MKSVWRLIRETQLRPGYPRRAFATSNSENDILQYCVNILRQKDFENYLCTLLIPKHARTAAVAIRAFNVEIAQVEDSVSERHIGRMRLQFWKDTLNNIYLESPPSHPVALLLAWNVVVDEKPVLGDINMNHLFNKAVSNNKLTKRWFMRLLEAREKHLEGPSFSSIVNAEEYGEHSVSSIFYLLLETLGVKSMEADHVASHLGKSLGLATLLRAVPYHIQARKVYLPTDVLIKHGVSHEDIIRRGNSKQLSDVVFDIASAANNHLEKVTVGSYLSLLQQVDFNPFDSRLQQRNWKLPWRLLYVSITRKL